MSNRQYATEVYRDHLMLVDSNGWYILYVRANDNKSLGTNELSEARKAIDRMIMTGEIPDEMRTN